MLPHQRPWVVLKKLCANDRRIAPKRRGVIAISPSTQATSLPAEPASFSRALHALMQGGLSEAEARAFLAFGKKLPIG
jgi:hypothetical protein